MYEFPASQKLMARTHPQANRHTGTQNNNAATWLGTANDA